LAIGLAGCGDSGSDDAQARAAAQDFARYCALCHGERGEGYANDAANALANPEFLATASDELLRTSIERGRPGTPMSAWGAALGGPLDPGAVDGLIGHVRGFADVVPAVLDDGVVAGAPDRGQAHWDVRCASCHGDEGQGGTYLSVANPEFLAVASDAYIRHAISAGRPGTPMQAWRVTLTDQAMDDLTALIRSWARPPSEREGVTIPQWAEADLVLNPSGPAPAFAEQAGRFVSVADVAAALDDGAKLGLLDARPPADWAEERIAGAMSLPFYAADDLADRLPADVWLVAYCGCPHAESELLVDALEKSGLRLLKVLDEGFFEWKARGLPLEG
jgi:cytochrome c oxidase cbb3-type subunit 3/ubiquinol-cytochrome c reductase cytochrome c subunit